MTGMAGWMAVGWLVGWVDGWVERDRRESGRVGGGQSSRTAAPLWSYRLGWGGCDRLDNGRCVLLCSIVQYSTVQASNCAASVQ